MEWIIPVVILVVVVLLVVFVISIYNKLVVSRNKVRNSWSQIDVQLKRRFDLLPNLMETVKGYAKHEKDIFEQFARARSMYDNASKSEDVTGMAQADSALSRTLGRLIAVSEAYPELKADKHFSEMMGNLKETEDKIAFSRQFYNDVALSYNNMREVFPTIIIANMFNFKMADYFKAEDESRENVKVSF